MSSAFEIVSVASLIGEPTRASMLMALMGGKSLTAIELAMEADITPQTASSHLSKLQAADLISVRKQGRHKYFCLKDRSVAELLEKLSIISTRPGKRVSTGPKNPELAKARVCYDHMAGDIGVALFDGLLEKRLIKLQDESVALLPAGKFFFKNIGIELYPAKKTRRPMCRACLDWSVRRYHLAGFLGARILDFVLMKKWASKDPDSRALRFTARGQKAFEKTFLEN